MIINNHFPMQEIVDKLNRAFLNQDFTRSADVRDSEELEHYKTLARNYALMENAISVLSDMRTTRSFICYGGFARTLDLPGGSGQVAEIGSVWEKEILSRIHPADLSSKYLQELRFFRFMKQRPKHTRADYCLAQRLRMKDRFGNWRPVLHRLFYISSPVDNSLRLTLCLYNPLPVAFPHAAAVINTVTGQLKELEARDDAPILSVRERQVLGMIDRGMTSKGIAESLSISIHTVSRHRQQILRRLQVRSSIEACRIAKELNIL